MTYGKIIKIGLTLFGATVLISLATFYISLGKELSIVNYTVTEANLKQPEV